MKIGDKVKFVSQNEEGVIIKINKNKVLIINSYGFEEEVLLNEIIPYDEKLKDISVKIKDESFDIKEKKETIKKNNEKNLTREIDLHIGHLVESTKNMKPHKMLQKQLSFAKEEIIKAKKEKISKLILIHGKGKGILKEKIYELLESVDRIEYFEADIIKYRFGAVEIRFK